MNAFAFPILLCALFWAGADAALLVAAEVKASAILVPHRHTPIETVGTPIRQRIPLPTKQPRCVAIGANGNLFVVDSQQLYRIIDSENAIILAKQLQDPADLLVDPLGAVYISLYAKGKKKAGAILRISPVGKRTVVIKGLTAPKGLARDSKGTLYVALSKQNQILRIDLRGKVSIFARNIGSPAGMAFDRQGNLLVVNTKEQTVSRISPKGKVTVLSARLQRPTEIAVTPKGMIIVNNMTQSYLTQIKANGSTQQYLRVPKATTHFAFYPDNNIAVVNRRLRSAIKIESWLSIPCPHCEEDIPLHIREKPVPSRGPGV